MYRVSDLGEIWVCSGRNDNYESHRFVKVMSEKVSRRKVIKMFGAVGVALAALPFVAKASAFQQISGQQRSPAVGAGIKASPQQLSGETLVLYVKGDQVVGYRGLAEIPVQDSSLAGMLNGRFSSNGGAS